MALTTRPKDQPQSKVRRSKIRVGRPLNNLFGKSLGSSSNSFKDSHDSEHKDTILEPYTGQIVVHSVNCRKLIGCHCTPIEECNRLDEERRKRFLESHKGRNAKRRAQKIERLQQSQTRTQLPQVANRWENERQKFEKWRLQKGFY